MSFAYHCLLKFTLPIFGSVMRLANLRGICDDPKKMIHPVSRFGTEGTGGIV
jgi:hypothetical protein